MAFPQQPVDAVGVPLSSSYIPDDNFYAIQASARKKTDSISNTYTAPVFEWRSIEDVRAGLVYSATTGKLATATNPTLTMGMSLFNPPGSGKNILVISARVIQNASQTDVRLNLLTVDPAFATILTPSNLKAGGAASVLTTSVTCAANNATASVAVTGTTLEATMVPTTTTPMEVMPPGLAILLPAGAANGVALFQVIGAAGGLYTMSFKWVEY